MRILIIRHGDPDYEHDSLTEKGLREANLLKERLFREKINAFYCSPLGRARKTAEPTLKAFGKEAVICDWLREFDGYVKNPQTGERERPWDRYPSFFIGGASYFEKEHWKDMPLYRGSEAAEKYETVCAELDTLLAKHGYVHDGTLFRAVAPNTDTLALFCHFGVECVLLSHMLNVSPVVLWQGFVALPTGVTTLYTEERERGIASLRCCGFGDLSHLYAGGEAPSFQARFCEVYSDFSQRH